MREKLVIAVVFLFVCLSSALGEERSQTGEPNSGMTANERQARRVFNQTYQLVFGEQGATLHYDVNITGIYKTDGTIWYKGKKSKFKDDKMDSWNDGTTVYTIKKKKHEVEIYNAKNNKSDKYSGKFKFEPENYHYSIANDDEGLMVTLKLKKGCKGMKEIHALVARKSYNPIRVRIKIAFIWTTIKITDFKSGGVTDDFLRFPAEKYKDYKFVDKR